MMSLTPSEFGIGGIFVPPLLVAALAALLATWGTSRILNRFRLSRHFFYPPLVYLSLVVIYSVLIGSLILPS
jgi:hypothetical protein